MDENHDTPAQVATSLRNELELVTEDELSSLLKVSKRQLYNWRIRGEIPYVKLGRLVRFRVGEVLQELAKLRVETHVTR